MNRSQVTQVCILGGLTLLIGAVVWYAVDRMYLSPKTAILESIATEQTSIEKYGNALSRDPQVQRSLRLHEDRTLGGDIESVDHELRARLNDLSREVGVANPKVDTGNDVPLRSPARRLFSGQLADEIDFVEVEGSIWAEGTFTQVVELIDRIDAEPWPKQIYHVSLDPKGNGQSVKAVIRLRTIFIPGGEPIEGRTSDWTAERLNRLAGLVESNPFVLPGPPPPVAKSAPPAPSVPSFPYQKWAITGLTEGPNVEVLVREVQSGRRRALGVGDRLHEMELVGVHGLQAHFAFGEKIWAVDLGTRMNKRRAVADRDRLGAAQ